MLSKRAPNAKRIYTDAGLSSFADLLRTRGMYDESMKFISAYLLTWLRHLHLDNNSGRWHGESRGAALTVTSIDTMINKSTNRSYPADKQLNELLVAFVGGGRKSGCVRRPDLQGFAQKYTYEANQKFTTEISEVSSLVFKLFTLAEIDHKLPKAVTGASRAVTAEARPRASVACARPSRAPSAATSSARRTRTTAPALNRSG